MCSNQNVTVNLRVVLALKEHNATYWKLYRTRVYFGSASGPGIWATSSDGLLAGRISRPRNQILRTWNTRIANSLSRIIFSL
jgi:hypothetical protein